MGIKGRILILFLLFYGIIGLSLSKLSSQDYIMVNQNSFKVNSADGEPGESILIDKK